MLDGDDFCREYFDFYVYQFWNKEVFEFLGNNFIYLKIVKIIVLILGVYVRVIKIFGVLVKGRYIMLVFYNQGFCSVIYFVVVSYFFCLEFIVGIGLVFLLCFMVLVNNLELVEG